MRSAQIRNRKISKKQTIWAGVGTLLVALTSWWAVINFMPHPLGDRLEYIGKEDYGCWLVCDSDPASVYYYATDMSVDELIAYFKKTNLPEPPRIFNGVADFTLRTKNDDTISVNYYIDKDAVAEEGFTKKTDKKAIISIPSFDLAIAKDSL